MIYSDQYLSDIITTRIKKDGPISFCDFMEMALYYPGLGYYSTMTDKIGINGDFYTSPGFTNIFGAMIGKQIEEMWYLLGKKEFTIVEYGAGPGILCRDILNYIERNKEFYNLLNYCIIEKSSSMIQKAKAILPDKVEWYDSIKDIGRVNGCIISNELLDNFAVHRVVMKEELMEVLVDHDGQFKEILQPASQQLKDYFSQLQVILPKEYQTEINLQANNWIKENATTLNQGYLMTIDYGYPSAELYNNARKTGTLTCYYKHTVNNNPYCYIGEQDITAHVNFSALYNWGIQNGLQICGYTSQADFLHALGIVDHIRQEEQSGKKILNKGPNAVAYIHTLMMDMSRKFKVMIQEKATQSPKLSGLFFAQQRI